MNLWQMCHESWHSVSAAVTLTTGVCWLGLNAELINQRLDAAAEEV